MSTDPYTVKKISPGRINYQQALDEFRFRGNTFNTTATDGSSTSPAANYSIVTAGNQLNSLTQGEAATMGLGAGNYTNEQLNARGNIMAEQQNQNTWLGEGGYLQTGAAVAQGAAGLMGAYVGLKGLGLAEDQLEFNKNLANKNYANQTKAYNTEVGRRAEIAAQSTGLAGIDKSNYASNYKKDKLIG